MRSAARCEVWRLFDAGHVEPVTDLVARRAGTLRPAHRRAHAAIGLGDYLIAATVDIGGLELATLNVKHFPMVKRLRAPFAVEG